MPAGELGQQEGRDHGRVGEGLAETGGDPQEEVRLEGADLELLVIGAVPLRDPPGVRALIEAGLREGGGECPHRTARPPGHGRDHGARVDSAGEEDAERNVAVEPHLDGFQQQLPKPLPGLGPGHPQLRLVFEPPVALDPGLASGGPGEGASRRQLLYPCERAAGTGDVLVDEEGVDRVGIERSRRVGVAEQCPDLGREREVAGGSGVDQRFLAEPVPGEEQAPRCAVPDREREHAAQTLHAAHADLLPKVDDDLGVGATREAVAARLQLPSQLAMVVDLSVEDQHRRAVLRVERLIPARDVDDREPGHPDRGVRARVDAAGVGAAMDERRAHRADELTLAGASRGDLSGYPAHQAPANSGGRSTSERKRSGLVRGPIGTRRTSSGSQGGCEARPP